MRPEDCGTEGARQPRVEFCDLAIQKFDEGARFLAEWHARSYSTSGENHNLLAHAPSGVNKACYILPHISMAACSRGKTDGNIDCKDSESMRRGLAGSSCVTLS